MKSNHTPSPWRFHKSRHHAYAAWQWVLDSKTRGGMAIMEVYDLSKWAMKPENNGEKNIKEHEETLAEVEANSKLIEAAPEMLAALEYFVSLEDGKDWDGDKAIKLAREAITKARGTE